MDVVNAAPPADRTRNTQAFQWRFSRVHVSDATVRADRLLVPEEESMGIHRRLTTVFLAGLVAAVASLAVSGTAQSAPPAGGTAGHVDNAIILIVNWYSGKCVRPENGTQNALIRQYSCLQFPAYRWELRPTPSGYYQLVNQAGSKNMCLDLQANSEDEVMWGTRTQQFYCNDAWTSELWWIRYVQYPYFQLRTYVKDLCLDVRNRSGSDGALLQLWGCNDGEQAQLFRLA
jgi:hypothetical protein